MGLLESNWGNLALGLASIRNPGLLTHYSNQKRAEKERQDRLKKEALQLERQKKQDEQNQINFGNQQYLFNKQINDNAIAKNEAAEKNRNLEEYIGTLPLDQQIAARAGFMSKPPQPYTMKPGDVRFDGNNKQIASVPLTPKPEDTRKNHELTFKNEKALRGEFNQATKTFSNINNAFGRIRVSAEEPSAAGDLSLIFNYMKMLDPESVVRESEFALAAAAGDYGERIQGVVNKVVSGQRLTATQRKDFVGRSRKLYNEAATIHKGRKNEFIRLAKANKLNPENVVFNRQFYSGKPIEPPKSTPKTQVRTGTYNGKKIIEYSDGTVEYAD